MHKHLRRISSLARVFLAYSQQLRSYSHTEVASLEVEKKFKFTPHSIQTFENNRGPVVFNSVEFINEKEFRDIYFDDRSSFALTTRDIWLRKRQEIWECKIPVKIASKMDSYHELENHTEIYKYISRIVGVSSNVAVASAKEFENFLENSNISPFATICTTRRKYLVNNKFTVDLDSTDFGHSVGEIELMVHNKEQIIEAEKQIIALCEQHSWFFDTKNHTMGKLLMYIKTFNPQQYQALVECGLIAQKLKYK